ncbi:hypothetical protein E6C60_2574 [Paenibacillus algicola]|uniref:Dit-like phage tail protein N-terminal domain-containing protein n=1 Tax=Paenibacillus algicola TaxID=2565926 RepID=A0A4P8XKP8_9BACL|nr:hypothetical protein [Paenibacillus algicola]QCT03286.1 hypothetical protein E6C60_2574 [Paenibacillus algicola]
MATINGHYLSVAEETPEFAVDVTDQPVEKEVDVSDHVQRKLRNMSITGTVVEDAAKIERFLKTAVDQGEVVRYVGRTTFSGLITSFTPTRTYRNATGFDFSITIKEVRFASSSYVKDLPLPLKAQVAKIVNSGTKQKKSNKKSEKKTTTKKTAKATTTKKTSKKAKEQVQKVKFKPGSPWAD